MCALSTTNQVASQLEEQNYFHPNYFRIPTLLWIQKV